MEQSLQAYIEKLLKSKEYQKYVEQRERVKQYPDLKKQIDEYQRKQASLSSYIETVENELKKQQTQEQIASGVQNTIGIFDKIKSIFSKKDDDKKDGGGFFSDIIEALLGPKALSYLSSGIGLLASGATLLAKGGIGLAIATYIGPTVIDIVKGIGESIFKGIRATWPFSMIPGGEEANEQDKRNGQAVLRAGAHVVNKAYMNNKKDNTCKK